MYLKAMVIQKQQGYQAQPRSSLNQPVAQACPSLTHTKISTHTQLSHSQKV
ncbi:hypothetical protein HanIR_Chr16g0811301 [Helianthus annuus]|nr:hypothetical protein HanIR_Chr16g0811301 [Helianthus annuus]